MRPIAAGAVVAELVAALSRAPGTGPAAGTRTGTNGVVGLRGGGGGLGGGGPQQQQQQQQQQLGRLHELTLSGCVGWPAALTSALQAAAGGPPFTAPARLGPGGYGVTAGEVGIGSGSSSSYVGGGLRHLRLNFSCLLAQPANLGWTSHGGGGGGRGAAGDSSGSGSGSGSWDVSSAASGSCEDDDEDGYGGGGRSGGSRGHSRPAGGQAGPAEQRQRRSRSVDEEIATAAAADPSGGAVCSYSHSAGAATAAAAVRCLGGLRQLVSLELRGGAALASLGAAQPGGGGGGGGGFTAADGAGLLHSLRPAGGRPAGPSPQQLACALFSLTQLTRLVLEGAAGLAPLQPLLRGAVRGVGAAGDPATSAPVAVGSLRLLRVLELPDAHLGPADLRALAAGSPDLRLLTAGYLSGAWAVTQAAAAAPSQPQLRQQAPGTGAAAAEAAAGGAGGVRHAHHQQQQAAGQYRGGAARPAASPQAAGLDAEVGPPPVPPRLARLCVVRGRPSLALLRGLRRTLAAAQQGCGARDAAAAAAAVVAGASPAGRRGQAPGCDPAAARAARAPSSMHVHVCVPGVDLEMGDVDFDPLQVRQHLEGRRLGPRAVKGEEHAGRRRGRGREGPQGAGAESLREHSDRMPRPLSGRRQAGCHEDVSLSCPELAGRRWPVALVPPA